MSVPSAPPSAPPPQSGGARPHPAWLLGCARTLSVTGHPLVLIPLFLAGYNFSRYEPAQAALLTGAVVIGIVVPFSVWIYRRVRQGRYTNFDVSDRRQRHSMYPVLLGAMGAVGALGWLTHQPRPLVIGLAASFGLVATAALVNRFIKCSLHAAMAFFLAGVLVVLAGAAGLCGLLLAALVGASRVVLGRHSLPEVLVGALLGLITAGAAWVLL